jgi:hypothetical protein
MPTAEFLGITRLSSSSEVADMTTIELLDAAHLPRSLT